MRKAHVGKFGAGTRPLCNGRTRLGVIGVSELEFRTRYAEMQCARCAAKLPVRYGIAELFLCVFVDGCARLEGPRGEGYCEIGLIINPEDRVKGVLLREVIDPETGESVTVPVDYDWNG